MTLDEAKSAVRSMMEDKVFGASGDNVVIEEFLTGPEVSVLAFTDGKTLVPRVSSMDHKRARDNDQGLNTGGMGTFSPSPFYTPEIGSWCMEHIYKPTMAAMKAEGRPFKGILFVGLMLTEEGPKVLEYNARFGDPETQVVLPRMKTDLVQMFNACIDGTLDQQNLEFEDNAAVCVVLASDGYPLSYEKGFPITGFEKFHDEEGYYCFHAGSKFDGDAIVTNGGRVLGVTAKGATLKEARENAYKATEWIEFANKYMRHDIGKAIDEA
jgi:phosphoribosylamine--glycine ligase